MSITELIVIDFRDFCFVLIVFFVAKQKTPEKNWEELWRFFFFYFFLSDVMITR